MQKKNVRVAICSSGAGHVFRGIEKWSYDMAHMFREKNIQHTFFKGGGTNENPDERTLRCLHRNHPLSHCLTMSFRRFGGWRYGLGNEVQIEQGTFLIPLLRQLKKGQYDIIHTQEYSIAAYLERLRKKNLIRPKVILAHGTNETNEALMKFEFLQHLTLHELEARKLQGCYRPTWTAIPNFVDTDTYRPPRAGEKAEIRKKYGLPSQAIILLTVAAIKREHKRIDWLIEELFLLKESMRGFLWLVIGGREKETEEIVEMGKERLRENVVFFVDIPHDFMPDLYRCADLFVLGSLREMFGIVLIEAMASGLPCFVHDHPVLKYVVGETGIVTNMEVHGELAAIIRQYLEPKELIRKKMPLARRQAVDLFSEDVVFKQTMDYYERVICE